MYLNLGLLGSNIRFSKSPGLHKSFGDISSILVSYSLFDIAYNDLNAFIEDVKRKKALHGFNVTAPYKETILEHLDSYDNSVYITKSCNTVVYKEGVLHGISTDGPGFYSDLTGKYKDISSLKKVLILGFGGAARAVCNEIIRQELPVSIDAYIRDIAKYQSHDNLLENINVVSELDSSLGEYDLIVQATSINQYEQAISIPDELITTDTIGYDLNYGLKHEWFKSIFSKRGMKCSDGLGMLEEQAKLSFQYWQREFCSPN